MTIHIGECILGVFAFSEDGKLIGSEAFPRDAESIFAKLLLIRRGEPTSEHLELLTKLIDRGHRRFSIESQGLVARLREEFPEAKFEVKLPNRAGEILRGSLREMAPRMKVRDVDEIIRRVNILLTREELRRAAEERDRIVIQAIDTMDELDRTANALYGKLREWYSVHFPELDRLVPDHKDYFKLVSELGARENFSKEAVMRVTKLSEKDAETITQASRDSVGADFDQMDIQVVRDCVEGIRKLCEARERVSRYVDELMAQVAPNIRAVVGSSIGARLVSIAGGLKELARMPASTIQVLGAEKALFRALHKRGKPPKHGVIYQYPKIHRSPKKLRGKIARALAGKLSIAARVDAMSGEFVGDRLRAELDSRIANIERRAKGERQNEDTRA
ncbi:MAG: C/D box methylation guide ribonucleoprotein complex aNOP56 subunit [Hadesarchaea archaeon]|nr:C/D box methylation guide ribonucleoprotein complex aNOP56 subunit [Hadesarchaea archaeon]